MDQISLSAASVTTAERAAVMEVLDGGSLAGDGAVCHAAEEELRALTGARHALLTTSCTHALEMAVYLAGLGPGDEVVLPSFTFTSTANAVVLRGARPVFVDIDPRTFNLDPDRVAEAITPRTRALLPVHYAGQGCDMAALLGIAAEVGATVIEDAAQGVGATWDGRGLGTIGAMGCYSFHATKNITCGEGGAFVANDPDLAERAEVFREKGTNRAAFLRGQIDKYSWVAPGSSYVLSDVLAAILLAQLRRAPEINATRARIWQRYHDGCAELEADGLLTRPWFDPRASNVGHVYAVVLPVDRRDAVMARLRSRGIGATFHYVPLHSSPWMRSLLGDAAPELPVTDRISAGLLRLPLHPGLTDDDVERVLAELTSAVRDVGA